jgi:hypothetical protein
VAEKLTQIVNLPLPLSKKMTHEYLKQTFNGVERLPGNVLVGKSTASLTTAKFSEYCEKIRAHASAEWGLSIPGPGEEWEEEA